MRGLRASSRTDGRPGRVLLGAAIGVFDGRGAFGGC